MGLFLMFGSFGDGDFNLGEGDYNLGLGDLILGDSIFYT